MGYKRASNLSHRTTSCLQFAHTVYIGVLRGCDIQSKPDKPLKGNSIQIWAVRFVWHCFKLGIGAPEVAKFSVQVDLRLCMGSGIWYAYLLSLVILLCLNKKIGYSAQTGHLFRVWEKTVWVCSFLYGIILVTPKAHAALPSSRRSLQLWCHGRC